MTMKSRGMGIAKKTPSKKVPFPGDAMSAGAAASKKPMPESMGFKKGGCVAKKKGGSIDGCAKKGHTKGKFV